MVKAPKLTMAQVYTLRRLASGTSYSLRGDGLKGIENRPEISVQRGQWYKTTMPYAARSLPALFRLGLVQFRQERGQEPEKYYRVQLTDAGLNAIHQNKGRKE